MSKTTVTIETVYADGSGAPAIVTAHGIRFAADYLGEVRLTGLSGRATPRRTIEAARRAYSTALRLRPEVSADWYDRNSKMYPRE